MLHILYGANFPEGCRLDKIKQLYNPEMFLHRFLRSACSIMPPNVLSVVLHKY